MKKEKKEKLLKKYLSKKEKQKKRDELFVELKKYETKDKSPVKSDVKIKNKAKKEKYKNITFKLNKLNENELVATKPDNTVVSEPEVKLEIAEYDTSIATGMKERMENIEKKTDNITTEQNEGIDDIFLNLKKPKLQRSKKVEMERKKLPVYYEEENIVTKIKQYDVSVIQGPTGCGKSTQIPQFIFENGLNRDRKILITQPRRLAAINIAKRIGYELNSNVCGYQIRHESTVDSRTLIKVVTEGIMLNEIKNDFLLSDYTFIIMDEIHEKTANSEIILALLKQIQKERAKRNDPLKIILMSADVKIDDYQLIFDNKIGTIALESNSHKVDVFYEKETPRDYLRAAYEKIVNILKDDKYSRVAENEHLGILVFVPGKEDIYSLIRMVKELKLSITLLPLHSSLPFAKQNHMYHAFTNTTIIVSTNIAETSLTIPGISIVIDTGLAKFKQLTLDKSYCYSVNYISKSSANQRKGRAGRVSDGLCFRLYSSKLFDMLREAEQPEILNMRLETHILALKAMGIENIRSLAGLVAIPDKNIQSGLKALENYGAIDKSGAINEMGQQMAQIPLDVRYARMVLTKCIYTDYLILAASILTYDFDVMNNSQTVKFYSNCKSDIIVKMRIIIDYNYCEDKQEFAKEHKISSNTMDEIIKLYKQLCCIVGLPKMFAKHMDTDIELKLLEIFTLTFCDNLAVSCGDYYTYNNVIVHSSKHSAKLDSKYIVFDHIIEGRSKVYIKNISCAESLVQ